MNDRVLFVDDDRFITEAVKRIFHRDAIEVLAAQSGQEALSIMETEPVAVVVTDQRMPGMTGSELLAEVRERYPGTTRIMLTGYATLELALDMINRAEVHRFLLKPCSFVELGDIVRDALERKAAMQNTRRLLTTVREQVALLDRIEEQSPEILEQLAALAAVLPEDEELASGDLDERPRQRAATLEPGAGGGEQEPPRTK